MNTAIDILTREQAEEIVIVGPKLLGEKFD